MNLDEGFGKKGLTLYVFVFALYLYLYLNRRWNLFESGRGFGKKGLTLCVFVFVAGAVFVFVFEQEVESV